MQYIRLYMLTSDKGEAGIITKSLLLHDDTVVTLRIYSHIDTRSSRSIPII